MRFVATPLEGAWIVQLQPHQDCRGLFARTYCAQEFGDQSLVNSFVQCKLLGTFARELSADSITSFRPHPR